MQSKPISILFMHDIKLCQGICTALAYVGYICTYELRSTSSDQRQFFPPSSSSKGEEGYNKTALYDVLRSSVFCDTVLSFSDFMENLYDILYDITEKFV